MSGNVRNRGGGGKSGNTSRYMVTQPFSTLYKPNKNHYLENYPSFLHVSQSIDFEVLAKDTRKDIRSDSAQFCYPFYKSQINGERAADQTLLMLVLPRARVGNRPGVRFPGNSIRSFKVCTPPRQPTGVC